MPFDKVEKNIYPFGRCKGRVVLLVRPIGVIKAGEYLGNPFHPGKLAHGSFSANDQLLVSAAATSRRAASGRHQDGRLLG